MAAEPVSGAVPIETLPGGLDLYATLESGQSYLWRREDGEMYGGKPSPGAWYSTIVDSEVVRVRQRGGILEWEATIDAEGLVRHLLRLDADLEGIARRAPDDPLVEAAFDRHRGLRLVDDPAFPTLISFICSAQMRVSRIHTMVSSLSQAYGEEVTLSGETYHAFPRPARLAEATEAELRELGLGYRAPYVVRTAEMVAGGESHPEEARKLPYEEAREYLTRFVGVGEKVADCVCLFALGFDEAVPLDTWIRSAIEERYPDCDRGSYTATSRAIRERFGGAEAGWVQTYVFHHLRTGGNDA